MLSKKRKKKKGSLSVKGHTFKRMKVRMKMNSSQDVSAQLKC